MDRMLSQHNPYGCHEIIYQKKGFVYIYHVHEHNDRRGYRHMRMGLQRLFGETPAT